MLNRIRRENTALQFDRGLQFHQTDNPELVCFSKTSPDGVNAIVVVVNLDPRRAQEGYVRVPLPALHGGDQTRFVMHDLLTDVRFEWQASDNFVRLDPTEWPAHVLRMERR